MKKSIFKILMSLLLLITFYLLTWPVAIEPTVWRTPGNKGYENNLTPNNLLSKIKPIGMGDNYGPEAIAFDQQGRIYASTHHGNIVRLHPDGTEPKNWVNTGGRPLGIAFDNDGNLIVADAFLGLLSINVEGDISLLTEEADGVAIRYANDVDVASNGKIYFSDATKKFGAKEFKGTYPASLLALMEHGSDGRLLEYDPSTGKTTTLFSGLNFANGVAISDDQSYLLINETGNYRVHKHWLTGDKKGNTEVIIDELPAFPDNITRGADGRFWLALVSPRNVLLDKLSDKPFIRKIIQRLPAAIRPKAVPYGHIIAINGDGKILVNLQEPIASHPINTSVAENENYLYIGSLVTPTIGQLSKKDVGL